MAHRAGRRTAFRHSVFALACLAAIGACSPGLPEAGPDNSIAPHRPQDVAVEAATTGATTAQGAVAEECKRLRGGMLELQDPRIAFPVGLTTASITLPGPDWCEIRMGPPNARTFVLVTPRVAARHATPGASPWQVDFAALQAGAYRIPAGHPMSDPNALRSRLEQVMATGSSGQGIEGFIEFARRPGMRSELGPADLHSRCVPLQVAGEIPAGRDPATGTNPPHARQFTMRARICLGPPGAEAALAMVFLQESTVGDPGVAGRAAGYDRIVERIFASLAFSAARPSTIQRPRVIPACQDSASEFDQVFRATASLIRVVPEPGATGADELAMRILVGIVEKHSVDLATQRRCFTEVLRSRGFRSTPTFDAARDMARRRHRPSTR